MMNGAGASFRTLLVGRHRLFRECLASRLEKTGRVRVVGQSDDLGQAVERVQAEAVDLVLVDLTRPDQVALEPLSRLVGERREGAAEGPKVVVLGLSEEHEDFLRCVEAGASGYVLQESSFADLESALERVLAGEVYCSPRVTYSMFSHLGELAREQRRHDEVVSLDLTPREMEVLGLLAEGLSNRQIAERVCLSIYTVKNHVHNILEKLDVDGREDAVERAYELNWLPERRRSVG